jgi:hypothetical protein
MNRKSKEVRHTVQGGVGAVAFSAMVSTIFILGAAVVTVPAFAVDYSVSDILIAQPSVDSLIATMDDPFIGKIEPTPGTFITIAVAGVVAPNISSATSNPPYLVPMPHASSSGNTVTVNVDLYATKYTVIGGIATLSSSGNFLNIYDNVGGSAVAGAVRGTPGSETASGNTLNFFNGTVDGYVGGGFITGGTVSGNRVNINPVAVLNTVSAQLNGTYGGIAINGGTLTNNGVVISGNGQVDLKTIVGASTDSESGQASTISSNYVRVEAGTGVVTATDNVVGAYIAAPSTTGANIAGHTISQNTVTLARGSYEGYIAGVFSTIVMDSGNVPRFIENSNFTGNTATINGSVEFKKSIFGAVYRQNSGPTNTFVGNKVTITGALVDTGTVSLAAGEVRLIAGADSFAGTFTDNGVTFSALNSNSDISNMNVYGVNTRGEATATKNFVRITAEGGIEVKIGSSAGGAQLSVAGANVRAGSANENEVSLSGKITVNHDLAGGFVGVDGGSATGNTVTLLDGVAVAGNIYGGAIDGGSAGGQADDNVLSFKDVKLGGNIFGGYSNSTALTASAKGNSLNFAGNIELTGAPGLFGGATGSGVTDIYQNSVRFAQVELTGDFGAIANFSEYSFVLDSAKAVAGSPAITAASLDLKNGVIDDAKVVYIGLNGNDLLNAGDTVILVQASGAGSVTANAPTYQEDISAVQGMFGKLLGTVEIETIGGNGALVFKVASTSHNEQAETFSELPLADLSFVNLGGDQLAGSAIPAAMASSMGKAGVAVFSTLGYTWQRVETGSHVDVEGLTGDLGLAIGRETSFGSFTAGLFLEFGDGKYDSYNDFDGIPSVHGEGDVSYIGGGLFGRLDFGRADASHPYAEASFRFGKTEGDYSTDDFLAAQGRTASYDLDAKYYGFHIGGGYVFDFRNSGFGGALDLSAKYFHTRREGDDFNVLGWSAHASDVTSSRVKAGARLSFEITPTIRPYVGAYYEHEFDGDSVVSYLGGSLPKATLRGSSVIGELGIVAGKPGEGLLLEMGVQVSGGRRDSVSVNLGLRYTF